MARKSPIMVRIYSLWRQMARKSPQHHSCVIVVSNIRLEIVYGIIKKTCYISQDDTSSTNVDDITDVDSYLISHQAKVIEQTSTLLSSDTKDKDDEFKELILLLLKENKDIQKTFLEILPHLNGNITNNSNNTTTNNNQFNINMFLNEHCKNSYEPY